MSLNTVKCFCCYVGQSIQCEQNAEKEWKWHVWQHKRVQTRAKKHKCFIFFTDEIIKQSHKVFKAKPLRPRRASEDKKKWLGDMDEVKTALGNECWTKQIFTQGDACILTCVYGWIYDHAPLLLSDPSIFVSPRHLEAKGVIVASRYYKVPLFHSFLSPFFTRLHVRACVHVCIYLCRSIKHANVLQRSVLPVCVQSPLPFSVFRHPHNSHVTACVLCLEKRWSLMKDK